MTEQGVAKTEDALLSEVVDAKEKFGPDHPEVAVALDNLAAFYHEKGQNDDAVLFYEQALEIREKALARAQLDVADALEHLTTLHYDLGEYKRLAERYQTVLNIKKAHLPPGHPDYHKLAGIYRKLGRLYATYLKDYLKAGDSYNNALSVLEQSRGEEDSEAAEVWGDVGMLCYRQGDYDQAEKYFGRAWKMLETVQGPEHPQVASALVRLAMVHESRNRFNDAEPLLKRALEINEKLAAGSDTPEVGVALNDLAALHRARGNFEKAEEYLSRAREIWKKCFMDTPYHPYLAAALNNLASLYYEQGKFAEAEGPQKQAQTIWEKAKAENHPDLAQSLTRLTHIHSKPMQFGTKGALFTRSSDQQWGQVGFDQLAADSHAPAKEQLKRAEPLCIQALTIVQTALHPGHPQVAPFLNNLAMLYLSQGRSEEAKPLFEQALEIRKKALGEDHPDVAASLTNLAALHYARDEHGEAVKLLNRALEIWQNQQEPDFVAVATALDNLGDVYFGAGELEKSNKYREQAQEARDRAEGGNAGA